MDRGNCHEETNHSEKAREIFRKEMNLEESLRTMTGRIGMAQEIFYTEMDLKICKGLAQGTSLAMLLETFLEERSMSEKVHEISHEEKNQCEMVHEIQCEEMDLEISHEEKK